MTDYVKKKTSKNKSHLLVLFLFTFQDGQISDAVAASGEKTDRRQ